MYFTKFIGWSRVSKTLTDQFFLIGRLKFYIFIKARPGQAFLEKFVFIVLIISTGLALKSSLFTLHLLFEILCRDVAKSMLKSIRC